MADITTMKAIEFTARARDVATIMEQAYWLAKRLSREWYGNSMSSVIANDGSTVQDGAAKTLTGADVTNIISNCDTFIADMEASSYAVLNVFMKASELPLE